MQQMALGTEWMDGDTSTHPTTGLLRAYYEDPDRLEPGVRAAMAGHLEGCAECAYDIEFLKGLEATLPAAINERVAPVTEQSQWPRWLSRPLPAFALASAIVVVLLIVLLRVESPVDESARAPESSAYILHELTRGASSDHTVTRRTLEGRIRVSLAYAPDTLRMNYRVRILNESETTEYAAVINANFARGDGIPLEFKSAALPDGRFFVVLVEKTRTEPVEEMIIRFPLEIQTVP